MFAMVFSHTHSIWTVMVLFVAMSSCAFAAEPAQEQDGGGYAMGLTMLGTMILIMGFWYNVQSIDQDIRRTTWEIINNTISIFIAALVFTPSSSFLEQFLLDVAERLLEWQMDLDSGLIFELKRYVNQMLVAFFYCCMFLRLAMLTRLTDEKARKEITEDEKLLGAQKSKVAVGPMWGHVTAFAGMHGWGMTQTSSHRHYRDSPEQSAELIPAAFFKWFAILCVVGAGRSAYLRHYVCVDQQPATPQGGRRQRCKEVKEKPPDELVKLFKEKTVDVENDIYGLFVSFLLVQSLRYKIGGTLPNEEGIEEGSSIWQHTIRQAAHLYATSLFLLGVACVVPSVDKYTKSKEKPCCRRKKKGDSELLRQMKATASRLPDIFINVLAMASAWCFMYATEWLLAISPLPMRRRAALVVLRAVAVTLSSFVFMRIIDTTADRFDRMTYTMRRVTRYVGFLVGFAWEATFEVAIESVTEPVHDKRLRLYLTVSIGLVSIAVILPAWRQFILPMTEEKYYRLGFNPRLAGVKIEYMVRDDHNNKVLVSDAVAHLGESLNVSLHGITHGELGYHVPDRLQYEKLSDSEESDSASSEEETEDELQIEERPHVIA
eukprot:TRINITY_DN49413_c0_g1_i1.p1 TRINITY_DN49413_c0_g1~~TRINITY_DN49413_c0_g1_i1.p1  ORF type:complete len:604 (-),score=76.01 TRINITY_DN49413_c0_g1_i1:385-2196(-)